MSVRMGATRSVLMLAGRVAIDMVSFIVFTVLDARYPAMFCSSKLQWEDISDTLYARPSLLPDLSKFTVKELKRLKVEAPSTIQTRERTRNGTVRSTFTINSTIVEMLQCKIERQRSHSITRWSDCDCMTCASSTSFPSFKETSLFRPSRRTHRFHRSLD
ncbi:hypothetical protein NE237_002841 [Protea cynaroides]|uniref:Uncharacterized protein n=1 Tax=Protea cynaroides TaxID=273540 RepID=A0A9Q0KFU7_9MAGN|nr:hypothetical protein NE237_002841 [Protea cynaroides]